MLLAADKPLTSRLWQRRGTIRSLLCVEQTQLNADGRLVPATSSSPGGNARRADPITYRALFLFTETRCVCSVRGLSNGRPTRRVSYNDPAADRVGATMQPEGVHQRDAGCDFQKPCNVNGRPEELPRYTV